MGFADQAPLDALARPPSPAVSPYGGGNTLLDLRMSIPSPAVAQTGALDLGRVVMPSRNETASCPHLEGGKISPCPCFFIPNPTYASALPWRSGLVSTAVPGSYWEQAYGLPELLPCCHMHWGMSLAFDSKSQVLSMPRTMVLTPQQFLLWPADQI